MSRFSVDPTKHDLFVTLAVQMLTYHGRNVELLAADGALADTRMASLPTPPVLGGYRMDALLSEGRLLWFLEVKSFADVDSSHSRDQYRILGSLLESESHYRAFVVVFDVPTAGAAMPDELSTMLGTGKLVVHFLPELGGGHED